MFDLFDVMAFAVFGVLIAVAVIIIVTLGQLPGKLAAQRGHPQASAINVAGWLGVASFGILWPIAMVWAFLKPSSIVGSSVAKSEPATELSQMQARVASLEATMANLPPKTGASR